MNRKHNIEEYLQVVSKLKINSEIKFSSDFIIDTLEKQKRILMRH